MGWLIDLITRLVAMLFHRPAPTPPESQEAVQAASAATAETKLQTAETTNAQVAQAVQAERQSDARLAAHPDELRAPSPDSRD